MKRNLLIFLSLLLPMLLMGEPVSKEEAKSMALSFINGRSVAKARGERTEKELRLVMSEESFHIFNLGSNEGFVIVSGDDCAPAILGYADKGSFESKNMPVNIKSWLQGYDDQIKYMKAHGLKADQRTTTRTIKSPIAPLLTCTWNQGEPYYNNTPIKKNSENQDEHCVTGCVATAMAQIMYYHKYPTSATTAIPGYKDVPDGLVSTTFNWNNMYDNYTGSQDGTEVAKLMQYCGTAVQMEYDLYENGGSSAYTSDVVVALKNYFGYDAGAKYLTRSNYSYSEWLDLIYDELAHSRPVLFSGQSTGGGHAFVCDGFSEDDFYHINWGWGGLSDGHFRISLLNPEDQGAGGSTTNDGFNLQQGIGVGIQRNQGGSVAEDVRLTVKQMVIGSNINGTNYNRLTRSSSSENFCLTPAVQFYNVTGSSHVFDYGIRIMKGESIIREDTWGTNISLGNNYYIIPISTCNFGSGLEDGTYKIMAICKENGQAEWQPCIDADKRYIEATITGNTLTYQEIDKKYSLSVTSLTFPDGTPVSGENSEAVIHIINNGTLAFHGDISLATTWTENDKNEIEKWGGVATDLEPGESKDLHISHIPDRSGKLTINVYDGLFNGDPPLYSTTITISSSSPQDVSIALSGQVTNNSGNILYGNTFSLSFLATNNHNSNSYNYGFTARIYKVTSVNEQEHTVSGQMVSELTDNITIAAGNSATLSFCFSNLEYGERYFCKYGYYSYSGSIRVFNQLSVGAVFTVTHGFITIDSEGNVTATAPTESVTIPSTAAVVDLRGQTTITSVNATAANPNCIYLLDEGAATPSGISKNIVKGTTAESIELKDGNDFYTPIDFTATTITYERTFTQGNNGSGSGWTTICLPFKVTSISAEGVGSIDWFKSSEDSGKRFWMHSFINDDNEKVYFGYTNSLEANTPYLISVPGSNWGSQWDLTNKKITFTGSGTIRSDASAVQSGDNFKFYGSVKSESLTNVYALDAAGSNFDKVSTTIPAFRAYFTPSNILNTVSSLGIGFDNGTTGIFEINLKPQLQLNDETVYNLRGEKVGTANKLNTLPKGIYIINGKKVIR